MEETLEHQAAPQCFGLPPTGTGNHRPDGSQVNHALTFKPDRLDGADHGDDEPQTLFYQSVLIGRIGAEGGQLDENWIVVERKSKSRSTSRSHMLISLTREAILPYVILVCEP